MALRTNIVSNSELKEIMRETLDFLSHTLSRTLGPYGTTTIIQDRLLNHQITKDGYSLLKKIFIEEEEARTILDLVKKISRNLVRKVGDGSTSSIIIANSLYNSLSVLMDQHKIPAKDLLDILNEMASIIADEIKALATPVSEDMIELESIAAVSTNNDEDYGKLVAEIFRQVGKYGFITLEKSRTEKTYYDITRGFEIPRGWINNLMVNQPDEKTCEMHDPFILMCDDIIRESDLPFIAELCGDVVARNGQSLVILAKGFDNGAATFFHINVQRNKLPILAVELAVESKKSHDRFKDLAITLGAKPYAKSEGESFTDQDYLKFKAEERLGRCAKVISTDMTTRFIQGRGDEKEIADRVAHLQEKLEEMNRNETYIEMDDDVFTLRKRMASMQNSMAILYVGGASEDAKDADKYLLEDAVFASRSALNHGYILGGNLIVPTLLRKPEVINRLSKIDYFYEKSDLFEDFTDALNNAFLESFICVLSNFFSDREKCVEIATRCVDESGIYNLKTHEYEWSGSTKIINSAETDIEILKSAISIIGLLATSNQFIKMNTR